MRTLTLGPRDLRVSELCLGTMYLGTTTDRATSYRLLDQYVEAGGSFLDTANIYAHWVPGGEAGVSESLLGRWLAERGHRNKMFIASKVGFAYPGCEGGLRAAQIRDECEKSLRRLAVDTIDLYYAHCDDRDTPLEEVLAAFDALVQSGKVRAIGASNYAAWRLEEARCIALSHDWPQFCCIQQRYSYLRPRQGADTSPQVVGNEEMLDYCRSRGIAFLAYTALMRGAYGGRPLMNEYRGPDTDARLATLTSVARETDTTPGQVVLAWLLQSNPTVIPVISASNPEQLAENLAALALTLNQEQMARLNTAGV